MSGSNKIFSIEIIIILLVCAWERRYALESDVKSQELIYLANHLSQAECRHLVASLNCPSYQFPDENDLISAAAHLGEVSCLDLLEHWNREAANDTAHVSLTRRLNQMRREDLAAWLSETVFQDMAKGVEDSIHGSPDDVDDDDDDDYIWTESVIQVEEPADELLEDVDDDGQIALDAVLISGGAAGVIYFIYLLVKMILVKQKQRNRLG